MEDKLHNFFSENDFDTHEPRSGHFQRFEERLQGQKKQTKFSWKKEHTTEKKDKKWKKLKKKEEKHRNGRR